MRRTLLLTAAILGLCAGSAAQAQGTLIVGGFGGFVLFVSLSSTLI